MKQGRVSPSSNGVTFVLGVKVDLETNRTLETMAISETKGNKSEMIRILLSEAIRRRSETTKSETTESETTESETTKGEN